MTNTPRTITAEQITELQRNLASKQKSLKYFIDNEARMPDDITHKINELKNEIRTIQSELKSSIAGQTLLF